jgi:C2H2 type zinc-finger (2 copies)
MNAVQVETFSEAMDAANHGEGWEAWDLKRSLFDNHASASFQKNLEYMYKHFGFALPDAQFCMDPEGMLQYLGAWPAAPPGTVR